LGQNAKTTESGTNPRTVKYALTHGNDTASLQTQGQTRNRKTGILSNIVNTRCWWQYLICFRVGLFVYLFVYFRIRTRARDQENLRRCCLELTIN